MRYEMPAIADTVDLQGDLDTKAFSGRQIVDALE
jgi:hypothetical protein